MVYLEIIIIPIIAMLVLFILTKLLGYRQITQLSLYDYIIGITIGSLASEVVVSSFTDFLKPLCSMVVIALFTCLLSLLTRTSLPLRKLVEGKVLILYENDQINLKSLKIAKIDLDEFLMICRINDYFNLSDLDKILLETNGRFSFYPKESYRPLQYNDLNKELNHESFPIYLIKESKIMIDNLKLINKDLAWLERQLKTKGLTLSQIKLLYQDSKGNLTYYLDNQKKSYFI